MRKISRERQNILSKDSIGDCPDRFESQTGGKKAGTVGDSVEESGLRCTTIEQSIRPSTDATIWHIM